MRLYYIECLSMRWRNPVLWYSSKIRQKLSACSDQSGQIFWQIYNRRGCTISFRLPRRLTYRPLCGSNLPSPFLFPVPWVPFLFYRLPSPALEERNSKLPFYILSLQGRFDPCPGRCFILCCYIFLGFLGYLYDAPG